MQETEECPVNKKRATWETILDGKVCVEKKSRLKLQGDQEQPPVLQRQCAEHPVLPLQ